MTPVEQPLPVSYNQIEGWAQQDFNTSLDAFRRSAREILETGQGFKRSSLFGGSREDWLSVCQASLNAANAQGFFEQHFKAFKCSSGQGGFFTGYYEPLLDGSRNWSTRFQIPVYAKPDDLVAFSPDETKATGLNYGRRINGRPTPYFTREEIERGSLDGRGLNLCYCDSLIDVYFMHVQGNGRVLLPDGVQLRLSFAAKSGLPYASLGQALLQRGIGTPDTMSMQFLRGWLSKNQTKAQQLLWSNTSYIFFREAELEDPLLGAIGAGKVQLTPKVSLAVDRGFWPFGTPIFVNTQEPTQDDDKPEPFQKLMIAQDTGTAIKGLERGDVYWGWGEKAASKAGAMKFRGGMTVLLPNSVAAGLSA